MLTTRWRVLAILTMTLGMPAFAAEDAVKVPAPLVDDKLAAGSLQKAVVAGGCFWGVQGVYQHLKGVKNVLSGYSGGQRSTANYSDVSDGDSGHAEAVEIVYDPAQVTYGQILQVLFSVAHDPTQLNRQGPDVGTQYRSAIFYANESQRKIAQAYIAQLDAARVYPRRIVTKVDPLRAFYAAEDYHQDYLIKNPRNPYIVIHDLPKVRNFEALWPTLYVKQAATVAGGSKRVADATKAVKDSGAMMSAKPEVASGSAMMSAKPAEAAGGAMMSAKPAEAAGGAMMMAAKPNEAAGGAMMSANTGAGAPVVEGVMPALTGATGWLNSKPLTREGLRGKVVVIDFWTYSCINCLRAMPYINAWASHYKDAGLVVIGVHSPEFAFEKDTGNVRQAIDKHAIKYPVALDSDLAIWKAFNNRFWPAHYFVDAKGQIRAHQFGEGKYAKQERIIRQLLTEAGAKNLPDPLDDAAGQGVSAAASATVDSHETYLGYERAENFSSPGGIAKNASRTYALPPSLALNQWGLLGPWRVANEHAQLEKATGKIVYRFRARDLHLVLGPGTDRKPVRFRVTIDGKPPGANHGIDVDANGNGRVNEQRLYQLIRQKGTVGEHEFAIEFLDAGAHAYSFTFG
jgi:methionine-S-sulfoxide reductase